MKIFFKKRGKIKKDQSRGFSILEVLIVMSIMTVGMLGVSSLVVQNLQVQNVSKDTFIASMLAQEGVEILRNVRDENWNNWSNNWDRDIGDWMSTTFVVDMRGRSSIDPMVNNITEDGAVLYLGGDDYYTHDNGGTPTRFRRLITVHSEVDLVEVKCEVMWTYRNKPYNYEIESYLLNWR